MVSPAGDASREPVLPCAHLSRRQILAALGASAAVGCRPSAPPAPPPVLALQAGLAASAHRLWSPPPTAPTPHETVDIAIVGAGVAGLSAAWRLARAGYPGRVQLLELADRVGGTAGWGDGPNGAFPAGAHYITLPSPEARHVRAMLADLGVITGFDAEGRPRYRDTDLCFAPQERLYVAGQWIEGLWPTALATAADRIQKEAWDALVDTWTHAVGANGQPAFAIPVARSSQDPAIRVLARVSFADWLDTQGFDSPALRWTLEYATRDDFGTTLAETSAWAGLHYHCARRPDPADPVGTHVLTWPAGNGWLVDALAAALPWSVRPEVLVRRVEPVGDLHRLVFHEADGVGAIDARHVILAVPARVADHLVTRPEAPRPDFTPWRVVHLHCDAPPASRGVPLAWDSVVYQGVGLGYVSNAHQTGSYGGRTTLSWYEPLSGQDPAEARRALLETPWADSAARAIEALRGCHPDLLDRVQGAHVGHWGHGTTRPVPGLHALDAGVLSAAAAPLPGVSFAHTDLSGMSLFEEASWHGVRAAEEAMAALGVTGESLL
ncbi:MAG: NAD(P)-binding protein [Alphaproteobacteria bacterium]|nr:NAD(P)-binding protein [Alphaproteobacteria bacterium]